MAAQSLKRLMRRLRWRARVARLHDRLQWYDTRVGVDHVRRLGSHDPHWRWASEFAIRNSFRLVRVLHGRNPFEHR